MGALPAGLDAPRIVASPGGAVAPASRGLGAGLPDGRPPKASAPPHSPTSSPPPRRLRKYCVHRLPSMTADLVRDEANSSLLNSYAIDYLKGKRLNEEDGELWLHRGFEQLDGYRTVDPLEADAFLVPAYLQMSWALGENWEGDNGHGERFDRFLAELGDAIDGIREAGRSGDLPHVVMSPATAMNQAISVRLPDLVKLLKEKVGGSNVFAISYERNKYWAGGTDLENIVVAPYVVRPSLSRGGLRSRAFHDATRNPNSVFYLADARKHAVEWAGCNRSMVLPLRGEENMTIGLNEPVPPEKFQRHMLESDYCLVTCGDTPTSRRLTDTMVLGCIPIFVGTTLFGECEAPCRPGWGWTHTRGMLHLPYEDSVPWGRFPVVDEAEFARSPREALDGVFAERSSAVKEELRSIMRGVQLDFIYGWGDPLRTEAFGDAASALWKSIAHMLDERDGAATNLSKAKMKK